jgi:hypothetical protein
VRLLIVDDASTDGTAALADRLAADAPGHITVLHRTNKRGLGSAYVEGFAKALAAGADLVAQMDADLSHEPSVLVAMTVAIRDADLVIGSRYVAGGGVDAQWGWHRKLLSWVANRVVVPALLRPRVRDATSGYRLWRGDALARIAPSGAVRSSSYGFQVEMTVLASVTDADRRGADPLPRARRGSLEDEPGGGHDRRQRDPLHRPPESPRGQPSVELPRRAVSGDLLEPWHSATVTRSPPVVRQLRGRFGQLPHLLLGDAPIQVRVIRSSRNGAN